LKILRKFLKNIELVQKLKNIHKLKWGDISDPVNAEKRIREGVGYHETSLTETNR
jgi:hypothetical protein